MDTPRLRVIFASDNPPASLPNEQATEPQSMVRVRMGEIIEPLAHAASSGRNWVADFEDDPMLISSDLYEVIQAYSRLLRGAA